MKRRSSIFSKKKHFALDSAVFNCGITLALYVQVEILAEGDHVNELMVVVSGLVEMRRPSEWHGGNKRSEEDTIWSLRPGETIHLGSRYEWSVALFIIVVHSRKCFDIAP